jgi:hypothetical protein
LHSQSLFAILAGLNKMGGLFGYSTLQFGRPLSWPRNIHVRTVRTTPNYFCWTILSSRYNYNIHSFIYSPQCIPYTSSPNFQVGSRYYFTNATAAVPCPLREFPERGLLAPRSGWFYYVWQLTPPMYECRPVRVIAYRHPTLFSMPAPLLGMSNCTIPRPRFIVQS